VLILIAVAGWVLAVALLVGLCRSAKQIDAEVKAAWDADASSRRFVRKTWQP
jgi:hypothetical protein